MPLAEFPNLGPALPELFMVCVAMALLMLGAFQKGETAVRVVGWLTVLALVLTMLLVSAFTGARTTTFNGMFVTDPFAEYSKILILLGAILTLLISESYLARHNANRFEYPVLVLLAVVGMMMMVSANDLMALYVGLELQSLALYVLAAFQRDSLRSTEAGLKYFVLGALASGMLLYGASMIYGFAGTTSFDALAEMMAAPGADGVPSGVVVGIVFMLAGLAFKVSAVPFHMWTPDVYEGAPTPVTAFFAVAPKIAAISLLIRVMTGPFGDLVSQWQQVIIFISIASMFIGAFAAIAQRNIKRLMAYSSIGHIGYALIGVAVGNEAGVTGVLVYMAIYLFMNVGTFACILAMSRAGSMVEDIDDLAGLAKTHPGMAAALAVFMFSMAGIPPLAGFFGKFYVFLAAIDAGLVALAIIGVLTSVVSAFYYLRIIKVMYFDDVVDSLDPLSGRALGGVMAVASVFVLGFFLYPPAIVTAAGTAAASLFGG